MFRTALRHSARATAAASTRAVYVSFPAPTSPRSPLYGCLRLFNGRRREPIDPSGRRTSQIQRANTLQARSSPALLAARNYATEAKAAPTEVSSILEQKIRGVQEEAGLAETGRVLSVGCVKQSQKDTSLTIQRRYRPCPWHEQRPGRGARRVCQSINEPSIKSDMLGSPRASRACA
jgi:hypothetical protein